MKISCSMRKHLCLNVLSSESICSSICDQYITKANMTSLSNSNNLYLQPRGYSNKLHSVIQLSDSFKMPHEKATTGRYITLLFRRANYFCKRTQTGINVSTEHAGRTQPTSVIHFSQLDTSPFNHRHKIKSQKSQNRKVSERCSRECTIRI